MSTLNENVSPIVDLETANIILTSNLVNEKVNDYVTDRRARLSGFDPNSGIYETQKINLEFPSNSILVQFDGHRDAEVDFVYSTSCSEKELLMVIKYTFHSIQMDLQTSR